MINIQQWKGKWLCWKINIYKKKKKIRFFFKLFFHNCFVSNYFGTKINFNLSEILVLKFFKMVANQIDCSRTEPIFGGLTSANHVKFNPGICDVFGEACFNRKNVYKRACHFKPESKSQSMQWKHTDFLVKKTFWVQ